MSEKLTNPPRQKIRLKVLLPMTFGILIFLSLYAASTSWYLNREIKRDLVHDIANIDTMYNNLLKQRSDLMQVELEQIAENQALQQLMRNRDRAALLKAAGPIYRRLLERMQISHFYFHLPDKTVLLRVHKPERHGDRIDRHTLQQAIETGMPAQGIELGLFETFTLRVVIPWRQNGRLLGYLELGQEIERLVHSFFKLENSELFFAINKKFLNREQLLDGSRFFSKKIEWELFSDKVIILASNPQMLPTLQDALKNHPPGSAQDIKLDFDERKYQGLSLPLRDSARRQIGEFLVLHDVTAEVTDYYSAVRFMIFLCLGLGGGFLAFSFLVLGNTEKHLETTRLQLIGEMQKVTESNQQLEAEIDERKSIEAALNNAHNELEGRVQERTEQLWLALEQARQARKQLTSVVDSVADGLIVTTPDGVLQLLNASAAQLFSCAAEESIGQPLKTIIKDPALLKRMEDALAQELPDLRIEFSQMSADLQTPVFLQARTSVITGKQGEITGMIFLLQNISHERDMQRLKSEFISTAVHELSTPLTAIVGYTELLLSEQRFNPEDNREFLSIVQEKSEFLTTLVGEMLDISRIESGKPLELHKDAYTAEELFERPIHHFHHFSGDHQFSIDILQPQLKFAADKEKIWQVMENLCSNAVKYSPDGGEIKISGHPFENGYQVTIADQGIGMTQEQVARVFEKFYRCNQSNTSVGGTGLGMTIVKSIIDAHEGQIWIDSELGQQTSVHFVIPCG
jgi:PAS domain S-box-containing protein